MMAIPSVDAQSNTIEYFIHHEDVRRGGEQWEPRELDAATTADLWERVSKAGKFFTRRSPVGVVVAPTDGPGAGTELRIKDGDRSVTLRGPVGEIVMAIYGRVTRGLEIEGAQADVDGVPRLLPLSRAPRVDRSARVPAAHRVGSGWDGRHWLRSAGHRS